MRSRIQGVVVGESMEVAAVACASVTCWLSCQRVAVQARDIDSGPILIRAVRAHIKPQHNVDRGSGRNSKSLGNPSASHHANSNNLRLS